MHYHAQATKRQDVSTMAKYSFDVYKIMFEYLHIYI